MVVVGCFSRVDNAKVEVVASSAKEPCFAISCTGCVCQLTGSVEVLIEDRV